MPAGCRRSQWKLRLFGKYRVLFNVDAENEEATIVLGHQERGVAPVFEEFTVIPAAFDQDVSQTQGQRTVAAGMGTQPQVSGGSQAGTARIDHDQFGTAFPGLLHSRGLG